MTPSSPRASATHRFETSVARSTNLQTPIARGLHRLIYTSQALAPGETAVDPTLSAGVIASKSATSNAAKGVSGVLVSVRDHFIQILEGEAAAIEEIFERICCDMRHSDLKVVEFASITERRFESWSMIPLDARLVDDPEPYEDLFMSIRAGMAPASIISEVRLFVDKVEQNG